jgi:hypothetical protein
MLRTDAAHEAIYVDFDADGTRLRGWLYRPRGRAAAAPAVVMAHCYNCIKELYLDRTRPPSQTRVMWSSPTTTAISATATESRGRSWTRGCRSATTVTQSRSCRRWTAEP